MTGGERSRSICGRPFCVRALVLPGMMARRKGRIVNVSSIAAYGLFPYMSAYCASKAALSHMTRQLAASVKEHGPKCLRLGTFCTHSDD